MSDERPKIKRIMHESEIDSSDDDAILFYLQYNEDMTQIMLTVKSKEPITPIDYFGALVQFVDMINENPEQVFVDEPDHDANMNLH